MTKKQIIKAIAELDGLTAYKHVENLWSLKRNEEWLNFKTGVSEEHIWRIGTPKYLTSYDAIISVIKKYPSHWLRIENELEIINGYIGPHFRATPEQMCEALLRAMNKWKE